MISNFGWLFIILLLLLLGAISSICEDADDYKRKRKTDFDYLAYKDNLPHF